MKSGTSLFNKGLSTNLLKRCWPLWTAYLFFLVLVLPVSVRQQIINNIDFYENHQEILLNAENLVLNSGCVVVYASFAFGIAAVMAVFGFMYNPRTCGMLCSMPIRRESVFTTVWITGIAPMLAANLLTALIALASLSKYVSPGLMLRWLGLAVMGNIGFYGFGSFCAMLTGSIYILPVVYGVLNLTAYVAEYAARDIFQRVVYGAFNQAPKLTWLSPIVKLMSELRVCVDYSSGTSSPYMDLGGKGELREVATAVTLKGTDYLIGFAVAGLIFSALALLLYRNRRMETVSDAVAVDVLKPIFKYCLALGSGLVIPSVICELVFYNNVKGRTMAVLIGALAVLSAFCGYFAARMLINKTVRVFKGGWGGFAIACAVLLAGLITVEADAFGYEGWLPDTDRVQSVSLNGVETVTLKERENIEAARELQRAIISDKEKNEAAKDTIALDIQWTMADGSVVKREYDISCEATECLDTGSNIRKSVQLTTCLEAVLSQLPDWEVRAGDIRSAEVYKYNNEDNREEYSIDLTGEEAARLYNECILPDVYAGRIGTSTWMDHRFGTQRTNGISIFMEVRKPQAKAGKDGYEYSGYISLDALTDSILTNRGIEELVKEKNK